MKSLFVLASAAAIGSVAILTTSQPAHAIECDGNVQVNENTRIITPYCEHEQMARVARSYGIETSGYRLRNNINHKQRICEHIGHDIRLSSVCGGLRLEDRGGRWNS